MQTEHLTVTGMSCGGCASKVTAALNAVSGVQAAQVSLSGGDVIIRYDEKRASAAQLKAAVLGAGYDVNDTKAGQSKGCCCS
jgi:copper chaperone CopZ